MSIISTLTNLFKRKEEVKKNFEITEVQVKKKSSLNTEQKKTDSNPQSKKSSQGPVGYQGVTGSVVYQGVTEPTNKNSFPSGIKSTIEEHYYLQIRDLLKTNSKREIFDAINKLKDKEIEISKERLFEIFRMF